MEEKNKFRILLSVIICFVCISCSSISAQNEYYKNIPTVELSKLKTSNLERENIKKSLGQLIKIEKYLPKNAVKNASVDYTEFIQKAINENLKLEFPNYPILINEKGLSLRSNSVLFFNENSILKLKANSLTHYEILRLHDVQNVKLYYVNIIGDYHQHMTKNGEWGMGVSICGTDNIELIAPTIKQCWGDGIYLGISPTTNNIKNKNVNITMAILDENRRNGMSIISAENLNINQILVANTFGTPPMAGIDIEPDSPNDVIKNINLYNYHSYNNTTHALLFVLSNLYGKNQNIGQINVKNLSANYGDLGISFKIGHEKEFAQQPFGEINLSNLNFRNLSRESFLSYDGNHLNKVKVTIKMKNSTEIQNTTSLFNNAKNIKITQ